ncbi:hypothetical protein ACFE04_017147 [Oxalis oulophora]
MDYLFDQTFTTNYQPPTTTFQHQYNPFLDDMSDLSLDQQALALAVTYHDDNLILAAPTFKAIKPTFCETITLLNDQEPLALTITDDNLFLAATTFQATKPTFCSVNIPQNNQQAQARNTATPPRDEQAQFHKRFLTITYFQQTQHSRQVLNTNSLRKVQMSFDFRMKMIYVLPNIPEIQ